MELCPFIGHSSIRTNSSRASRLNQTPRHPAWSDDTRGRCL